MNATAIRRLTFFASDLATKLKALWDPLWSTLTFSADNIIPPKKNLCISIEKGVLSMAYGSRFLSWINIKGFRIYHFKDAGYPLPEELASTIPLAISELKAEKADITLSIPKEWVVIKRVELPVTAEENLTEVMSFELDRLTPFGSEDAYYDYKMLKKDDKKLTILLAAAKADLANKYLELLREKEVYVSRISVNLSNIGSLSRYINRKRDVIFTEISESGYEGALFTDGSMADVLIGSFSENNESFKIETITAEISSFVDTAKKQGRTPEVIISLKDKSPSFKEMLRIKTSLPVRMINEIGIKPGGVYGNRQDIPYAAVGGVLDTLGQKAKGFNLLKKGFYEKQRPLMFITIILLLMIVALWYIYLITPLSIEEKKLARIDSEIALRKKDIKKFEWLNKDIEQIKKEISDIKGFKERRPATLNIIGELTTLLPKNTWLTRMHITETTIEIEGYTDSAIKLLSKFEASRYFEKAEFTRPAYKDIKKGDRFSVRMEIEGAKKVEAKKEEEEGALDEEF